MSLAHSHKDLKVEDASSKVRVRPTEKRPRLLRRPDSYEDERSLLRDQAGKTLYNCPSGNSKPQEPPFLAARIHGFPTARMAGHPHAKPWTMSCQPGHKENPTPGISTSYRRTWMADGALPDKVTKWTAKTTKQFYADQDKALFKLKPMDEMFATRANMKYWTHLEDGGTVPGGLQKLDTVPQRGTGLHLKGGLYAGKFDNIKHVQLINKANRRNGEERCFAFKRDKRPVFDNRLKDDMIQANDKCDLEGIKANYDQFRPAHTLSCPQLGADFVNR